jgi:hypothetical protein
MRGHLHRSFFCIPLFYLKLLGSFEFSLSTISDSYILLLFLIVKNKLLICNNYLSGSVYVLVVFKIIFLLVLNKSKASYYLVVANSAVLSLLIMTFLTFSIKLIIKVKWLLDANMSGHIIGIDSISMLIIDEIDLFNSSVYFAFKKNWSL